MKNIVGQKVCAKNAGWMLVLSLVWGSVPSMAQVDLSGYWANRPHEDNMARGPGLESGEYEGFPLNAAGRIKGYSWDAGIYSNTERQCVPLGVMTANSGFRMWKEVEPVSQEEIAWHLRIDYEGQERTIWMDGRPHPAAEAPHTTQGFSTGGWKNNQLVVTTTHLKMNMIERNGLPRSDRATTVEHFMRRENIITVVHITYDPVFLEEPLIQTRDFALDIYARVAPSVCVPVDEIADRPKGYVPHYLMGKNPLMLSATKKYGVPAEAVGGGAETMYPEFAARLKNKLLTRRTPDDLSKPPAVSTVSAQAVVAPDLMQINITTFPVQGNIFMLTGIGNTVVQTADNGVYVVDSQPGPLSAKLLAAIRQISDKPIRYILNTSADANHMGGNEALSKAGSSLGSTGGGGPQFAGNSGADRGGRTPAPIFAHEKVLLRVSAPTGSVSPLPTAAWPAETFAGKEYRLFNGEPVIVLHQPNAHTDGDTFVFFQSSGVVAAGDVFSTVTYPVIDRQRGGSINGTITALNNLIDLCTPKHTQEAGTYVIPGRGRISDVGDVVEYRDMVTIIRDRIADAVKRGLTIERVKAEQPTYDYDLRYGAPTDYWTKDQFIEAVYQDLKAAGQPRYGSPR